MELNAVFTALNEALESKERLINFLREENGSLTSRVRDLEKTVKELETLVNEYVTKEVKAEESDDVITTVFAPAFNSVP